MRIGLLPNKANKGFEELTQLLEAEILAPTIDRCYPLHGLQEAMRYAAGEARGKVVITTKGD